ncbi:DinB family protein [Dyadobacter sp. CY261]|uniref:DinB family protein n=1 Tax=Dyadobacter sp. CY261 TaxID=2907203 RepID=UPI001F456FD9|nr:DinB family protein [Dyadobacter sp. CY261]MCF0075174.1 DinB family protein [Dyadobacter sp. CY261]
MNGIKPDFYFTNNKNFTMITPDKANPLRESREVFIKMVVSNWELQNQRLNGLLAKLPDERLLVSVAEGKNRAIYLLGHLVAINDGMISLLGLGERLYPELDELFVKNPDGKFDQIPSVAELKAKWTNLNQVLTGYFAELDAEEWFRKHNAISDEDFAREPHRNKLNILINRTNHQAYHLGQLIFLKA